MTGRLAITFVLGLAACVVPLPEPPDLAEVEAPECVAGCEDAHGRCIALARYAGGHAERDRNACRRDLSACYDQCASQTNVASPPPGATP